MVLIYFTAGGVAVEKAIKSYTSAIKKAQLIAKKAGKQAFDISKDLIKWLQAQLDELRDALKNDNLSEWFSKKIDEVFGEKKDVRINSDLVDKLIQKYGDDFIEKGLVSFRNEFDSSLTQIINKADNSLNLDIWKKDFLNKTRNISEEAYLKIRKMQFINFEKGKIAEQIFEKLYGGIKQTESIVTAYTKRFIDNVANNTAKEIKSGFIKNTKAFQKQIRKDVDILANELGNNIIKVEWHIMEGIDEKALDFIVKIAKENKVLDKFKIVLYK